MDLGEDGEGNEREEGDKVVHNLQVNTQHDNSNHMMFQEDTEEQEEH